MTLRAIDTLQQADVIFCEDTRNTSRLLSAYGIATPLLSCHEHNERARAPELLQRLGQGMAVALVSDAGMPLISDPGAPLVLAAQEAGFAVTVVPGANAALCALSLSGLPSDRFCFIGFLPTKAGARRQELSALGVIPASLIFYESPHRVAETLDDMARLWPGRTAAVVREITKLYEEVQRALLPELAARYAGQEVKGEVVIVVGPPAEATEELDVDALLQAELQHATARDAAAIVAARTGLPKREIYARAIAMQRRSDD